MAFNAAARRVVELTSYSALELVELIVGNRDRASDIDAVIRLLSARESRACKTEEQLKAALADATSKVQALEEDLRRASLSEAEGSARLRTVAEEEARALLRAAVSEIHEAGKKKQDEVSAHLDAALNEIRALHRRQRADLSARVEVIVDETEAKLKASFAKIHDAPLKKPERDAVPGQEMAAPNHDAAIPVLASRSVEVEVARKSKRPVMETVMVNKGLGYRAAADGPGRKSLKRKADAVEHRISVSPVQISGALVDDSEVPPGFSPTPRFPSETGPCCDSSLLSKARQVSSAKVSKELASAEVVRGNTVTLKEPNPSGETGEGRQGKAPSEATQDKGANEEPANLDGARVPVPVPVQKAKQPTTVPKEKGKNKNNVSEGSPSLGSGRGSRTSNTSVNWPVMGAYCFKRPSPVVAARRPRTVQKCSEETETSSQSRNENEGQSKTNTAASGHAIPGTKGLPLPSSTPVKIRNVSGAEIRCILGMGGKGKGTSAAQQTSDGTSGKDTAGGASAPA